MKYYLVVIILIFISPHVWTGESACPAVGNKVNFRKGNEVYKYLSSHEVKKDEFETTAQYEERRSESYAKLVGGPAMVILDEAIFSSGIRCRQSTFYN